MKGFKWTSAGTPSSGSDFDNWYLRDSFCRLFGWSERSLEWEGFIEGPSPEDTERLIDHLGLVRVDPMIPGHFAWLVANLQHPGVSRYNFHTRRISHSEYEPNIATYQGLPQRYAQYETNPELVGFLVDPTQQPRTA